MRFRQAVALVNLALPVWFLSVYLVISARRPEYSHLTKAISELGSLDAPDRWTWNLLGYVASGAVVALLGIALLPMFPAQPIRSRIASSGLVAFGLLMLLSGLYPADMSDLASLTSRLHILGSLGSYVGFLVAGFIYPGLFAGCRGWEWASKPSLALVWLSIATGFLRFGDMPGLGQRVTFALVFLWIALVASALLRTGPGSLFPWWQEARRKSAGK